MKVSRIVRIGIMGGEIRDFLDGGGGYGKRREGYKGMSVCDLRNVRRALDEAEGLTFAGKDYGVDRK